MAKFVRIFKPAKAGDILAILVNKQCKIILKMPPTHPIPANKPQQLIPKHKHVQIQQLHDSLARSQKDLLILVADVPF
jgi:hypothetical protein